MRVVRGPLAAALVVAGLALAGGTSRAADIPPPPSGQPAPAVVPAAAGTDESGPGVRTRCNGGGSRCKNHPRSDACDTAPSPCVIDPASPACAPP